MKSRSTMTFPTAKNYGLVQESHPHRHQNAIFMAIKSGCVYGGLARCSVLRATKTEWNCCGRCPPMSTNWPMYFCIKCMTMFGHTFHELSRIHCYSLNGKFRRTQRTHHTQRLQIEAPRLGWQALSKCWRSLKMRWWLICCQTNIVLSTRRRHFARKMGKSFRKWWKIFWLNKKKSIYYICFSILG